MATACLLNDVGALLVIPKLLAGGVEAHLVPLWLLLAFGVVPSLTPMTGPDAGLGIFDVVPFIFTSFVSVSALAAITISDGLVLTVGGVRENVGGTSDLGAMSGSQVQRQGGHATLAGECLITRG